MKDRCGGNPEAAIRNRHGAPDEPRWLDCPGCVDCQPSPNSTQQAVEKLERYEHVIDGEKVRVLESKEGDWVRLSEAKQVIERLEVERDRARENARIVADDAYRAKCAYERAQGRAVELEGQFREEAKKADDRGGGLTGRSTAAVEYGTRHEGRANGLRYAADAIHASYHEEEPVGLGCDNCGGPDNLVWWCHDPKLWEMVTGHPKPPGSENAAGLWCIRCFDAAAKDKVGWIEWAPLNIRHLSLSDKGDR